MEKTYLRLLIFCAAFLQAIAVISYQQNEKSSNLHIRKKRIISHSAGGVQPAHITLSRHLVQIIVADTFECAGSILQPNIVVTVRTCLYGSDNQYLVLSGSLRKHRGIPHRVIISVKHTDTNLALLKIHPPIILNPRGSEKIDLYTGSLPSSPSGLLSGWGCTHISSEGQRTYPEVLMAVLLPIITHAQCSSLTRGLHGRILPEHEICTLDGRRERGACYGDEGGSLTYANRLLGIYSHNEGLNIGLHPEVYVNLSNSNITRWINYNTEELQRLRHRIVLH